MNVITDRLPIPGFKTQMSKPESFAIRPGAPGNVTGKLSPDAIKAVREVAEHTKQPFVLLTGADTQPEDRNFIKDLTYLLNAEPAGPATERTKPSQFRSEEAAKEKQPDYLLLFTLKSEPGTVSKIVSADDIVKGLSKKNVAELEKPDFIFRSHHEAGKAEDFRGPILQKDAQETYHIRFDANPTRTIALTIDAQKAMSALIKYLENQKSEGVMLENGQILLSDNLRSVYQNEAADESGQTSLNVVPLKGATAKPEDAAKAETKPTQTAQPATPASAA